MFCTGNYQTHGRWGSRQLRGYSRLRWRVRIIRLKVLQFFSNVANNNFLDNAQAVCNNP